MHKDFLQRHLIYRDALRVVVYTSTADLHDTCPTAVIHIGQNPRVLVRTPPATFKSGKANLGWVEGC